MGGGKGGTTTSSVAIPPEVLARYNSVNARAETAAGGAFQPYTGQFVAGMTPTQQAGVQGTNAAANLAQPFYQAGTGLTMQGAQSVGPLTQGQIGYYQDPFTQSVVNPTLGALRQDQGQQRSMQQAQQIKSGAFGGDRAGLERANLARQQNLGTAQAIAPLYSQGYQTGVQTAMGQQGVISSDLQRKLAAGQQVAGLGTGAQGAALQGAQQQLAAGTAEQQTQQADLTAQYQQFLQQQGFPYQQAQFLANIAMGTGALSGSTTTTQQPTGFFSDRRLKHDVKEIGETHDGQPIYSYKYNGDNKTQIGLMAQDVEKHHPEAVGVMGGYKTVDYGKATEDSERPERAAGGLIPNSMGGGVWHPDAYAGGGLVDGEDMKAILQAQQAGFGPWGGGGVYGGAGAGAPGGKSPGIVPQASLPVPKLVTAGSPPARQASGLSQAAATGQNIASMGRAGVDFKNWVSGLGKEGAGKTNTEKAPAAGATEIRADQAGKLYPAGADAPARPKEVYKGPTIRASDAGDLGGGTQLASADMPSFGADDFSFAAARGGVIPFRHHRAGGGTNPYELSDDMSYIPKSVLKEGEEEAEQAAGQFKKNTGQGGGGGSGGSGLGEVLGVAKTALDIGKFAMPFFLKEGGVVPRHAYALDGAVDPTSDQPEYDPRSDMPSENAVEAAYNPNEGSVKQIKEPSSNVDEAQAVIDRAREVHAQKESGGDYGILGPVIPRGAYAGQRPVGRYQVMEGNIGPWTKIALGKEMTPEEFRRDTEAQDKVFNKIWGDNYRKYGNVPDAVSMWASGRPAAEGAKTRDIVFGTSTGSYIDDATRKILGKDFKAPEPGVSRSGDIGRGSTLGDVFSKITPDSIPSNENFWIPALAGVGSMLASNRPTLLGAVGEGLVGGVSGYQAQQKQEMDRAKQLIDFARENFVQTYDPASKQTVQLNKMTGQMYAGNDFQKYMYDSMKKAGISKPEVYGIMPPSGPSAPGERQPVTQTTSEKAQTVADVASSPKVTSPNTTPAPNSDKPAENIYTANPGQLREMVMNGKIPGGPADAVARQAQIDANMKTADEMANNPNPDIKAKGIQMRQIAVTEQDMLDKKINAVIEYQSRQNDKFAEGRAARIGDYQKDVQARAATYSQAIPNLTRMADIAIEQPTGRGAEAAADAVSVLKRIGMDRFIPENWKDYLGTPGGYDQIMKISTAQMLNQLMADKIIRAPASGAKYEAATVPSPTTDPDAFYALIGTKLGETLHSQAKDNAWVKLPTGTVEPANHELTWPNQKGNRLEDYKRQAFSSIPANKRVSEDAIRSLQHSTRDAETGETFKPRVPEGSAPAAAPVVIRNDAEYNALKPGTTYTAPDGSIRRKQ